MYRLQYNDLTSSCSSLLNVQESCDVMVVDLGRPDTTTMERKAILFYCRILLDRLFSGFMHHKTRNYQFQTTSIVGVA